MPLTASNTEADTRESACEVTSGLVAEEIAVSFVIAIQSRTGSDAKADTVTIWVKKRAANSSQKRMRNCRLGKKRKVPYALLAHSVRARWAGGSVMSWWGPRLVGR